MGKNLLNSTNVIEKTIKILFYIIFIYIAIVTLFWNKHDFVQYNCLITVVVSIITFCFLCFFYSGILNSGRFLRRGIMIPTVCLIIIFIQIIIAHSLYSQIGWDPKAIYELARNYIYDPNSFSYTVFVIYPNNTLLFIAFTIFFKVLNFLNIQNTLFPLVLLNILMIDITIFITFYLSKKVIGNKLEYVTLIFAGLLILFSPWITVYYSDTLGMFFPIFIIFLYFKINHTMKNGKKYLFSSLLGLVALFGFLVKPTCIIVLIAISLVEIITRKKNWLNFFICTLLCCSIFVGINIVYKMVVEYSFGEYYTEEEVERLSTPLTHFLMMGMQRQDFDDRGSIYGAYFGEDVALTQKQPTQQKKVETNFEVIKIRLKKFGVLGYIKFLMDKTNWMFSDGTFYYGGEGAIFAEPPVTTDTLVSNFFQSFMLRKSKFYNIYANILEGFWMMILILIAIPFGDKAKISDKNKIILVMKTTIIGLLLFLLLFEGRSRYLINHLPIFFLLATISFEGCFNILKNKFHFKRIKSYFNN
ncbi:hypothetical protein [Eubacterium limosum]|uniref:hypothetical protein n=1 Tax=Eubacterium limosum TaxID=1736 RepID=UPI003718D4E1